MFTMATGSKQFHVKAGSNSEFGSYLAEKCRNNEIEDDREETKDVTNSVLGLSQASSVPGRQRGEQRMCLVRLGVL